MVQQNRQKDARDDIRRAAITLHARKDIVDVTVSELCREAGVARTTFYAYYDNVSEPLEEVEDELVGHLAAINHGFASVDTSHTALTSYFKDGLSFVEDNRETFQALLINHPRMRFITHWRDAIAGNFTARVHAAQITADETFVLNVLTASAIEFYRAYVEDPHSVSPEDAASLITTLLHALETE